MTDAPLHQTTREWRWHRYGSTLIAQLWTLATCERCAGYGDVLPPSARNMPERKLEMLITVGRIRPLICGRCKGSGSTWRAT